MKVLTLALVVILIGIVAAKGQWKWKNKRKEQTKKGWKLAKSIYSKKSDFSNSKKSDYLDKSDYSDMVRNPKEFGEETSLKTYKLNHYFGKKKKFVGPKYKKPNKGKKMMKSMEWLNIQSDVDCDMNCKEGEVCISGPVVTKPICVHKKDLKKSMKLFHKFHKNKKENKVWRKLQKNVWNKEEKYGKKGEKYWKKFNKTRKYSKKFYKGKKFLKKENHHQKLRQTFIKPGVDCSGRNMVQMKNRLMGWFHLLHGQDRQARKAHGGSISKFYKHVSVKKELREVNGEECQCFKSAVWQFHQLDKSKDDHLTQDELSYLQENSVEPCLKPYLKSCDRDGDSKVSSDEWCCCFAHVLPPCIEAFSQIKKDAKPVTYLPRCDKEGYYLLEQCKGDKSDGSYECWCVDFNGNEYKDTLKKGRAHCHKIEKFGYQQKLALV